MTARCFAPVTVIKGWEAARYDWIILADKAVAERLGRRRILFSVPFPVWHLLARIAETLPGSALSRSQVDLMEVDTVASAGMPGFAAFGIAPQPIEHVLEQILARG